MHWYTLSRLLSTKDYQMYEMWQRFKYTMSTEYWKWPTLGEIHTLLGPNHTFVWLGPSILINGYRKYCVCCVFCYLNFFHSFWIPENFLFCVRLSVIVQNQETDVNENLGNGSRLDVMVPFWKYCYGMLFCCVTSYKYKVERLKGTERQQSGIFLVLPGEKKNTVIIYYAFAEALLFLTDFSLKRSATNKHTTDRRL